MSPTARPSLHFWYRASWLLVGYTILIIIWGAWVRLSGSGDGCGDHWPLCNGQMIPEAAPTKTLIELSHRVSTALYGIFVLIQIIATRRVFPKGHPSRFWSLMTLLFTITEALIGRSLVKEGLVNTSEDLSRLIVMPLHLVNTSLLLFSGVMTAESLKYGEFLKRAFSREDTKRWILYLVSLVIILSTGAIAALGSHLAPSESLLQGLSKDLSTDSHLAVRLRLLHPFFALGLPLFLALFMPLSISGRPTTSQGLWYRRFGIAVLVALSIGIGTLVLLAPLWLKVTHLLMTNLLVVVASLCVFHTLRPVPLSDQSSEHP